MTLSNWDHEYIHMVSFIWRRMSPECLKFYKNKKEDIVRVFELFGYFDQELCRRYYNENKSKFIIRYRELESLCKKYINKCKKESNYFGGYVFFSVLSDLKVFFKKEFSKYSLLDSSRLDIRTATKEEQEYAEKTFKPEGFSFIGDDTKILSYKGLEVYIYSTWEVGYILDYDNKVRTFLLCYDWWYPIDYYLYLERGWKKPLDC